MDRKLLDAKNAIFKMIAQFHHPTMFDDGELYIFNYCESALEAAFDVLGIEGNYIKLIDFCKMWEDNDRECWAMNSCGNHGKGAGCCAPGALWPFPGILDWLGSYLLSMVFRQKLQRHLPGGYL